jgi:hypothetical protein
LALLLPACSAGAVTLDLEVPTIAALNPLLDTDRLASFRLRHAGGGDAVAEARFVPGATLGLGGLKNGPAADFDLEGVSESGQVLAFGRVRGLQVSPDENVTRTVHLRKPTGYVAGGPGLVVRDVTRSDGQNLTIDDLPAGTGPVRVASMGDGTVVVVASGLALQARSTANHQPVGMPLALPEPALALRIDAEDQTLAVLGASGVTLVPLVDWLAGATVHPAHADLPAPAAGAFGSGGVLFVATGAPGCPAPGCSLYQLDRTGAPLVPAVALPEYAADLAFDRASGALLAALPGSGQLVQIDPTNAARQTLVSLPQATHVAATGSALVGFANGDTRRSASCAHPDAPWDAQAAVVLPGQMPRVLRLDTPPFQSVFTGINSDNQFVAVVREARITIDDAAVTADASRALLLATVDSCGDVPIEVLQPFCAGGHFEARTHYVLLVDLSSGVLLWTQATAEDGVHCSLCGIALPRCLSGTQLPMAALQFAPSGVSVLFGGR